MTLFWIIVALLIAGALGFVLPPLLRRRQLTQSATAATQPLNIAVYRDQLAELEADRRAGTLSDEQYERARVELEQRLLDDVGADNASPTAAATRGRASAIVMGLALPCVAVALYFAVGNPRALSPAEIPADASKGVTHAQVEAMVAKLAERMKQNPDDAQGWAMLGKSYAVMGRFDDAVAAYANAEKRAPDNPHLLADYADTLAMKQGQGLQGEPEALILRALKIDPNHLKSLALAGTIAFEKNDYAGALKYWEKLATLVPPDSDIARGVKSGIDEARGLLREKGGTAKAAATSSGKATNAAQAASGSNATNATQTAGGVSGTVTLAPALVAKAAPGDTVFIFARSAEGPRMPLAILRKKVSDLPLKFTLDDSLAMSPAARLSGAPQVIIGARISKSGDASPKPGDLQGASKPVNNTQQGVNVVIDTEVQ